MSLDFDYHLAQRYHGPSSAVFKEALGRVPRDDQWIDDCCKCGHAVFVQRSVREVSAAYGISPPIICVHCVVHGVGVPVGTVLNLEACPWGEQYCPYGNRNRKPAPVR
jgi:hypothetical protein